MRKRPFLSEKYPGFDRTPEVESASKREAVHSEEPVKKDTASKVDSYMNRLEEIFDVDQKEGQRERRVDFFKEKLYDKVVIKEDEIPESYFELQRRIAREKGHGDAEITPETRTFMKDTIIRDQKTSLDTWIDYMGSSDAPTWLKYYSVREISKLSPIDKKTGTFHKRSRKTISPFPELKSEALAYVLDGLEKKHGNGETLPDATWDSLLENAKFADLYAQAIKEVTPDSESERVSIKGEWIKYDKDSDYLKLTSGIQGHGTGWCTAGESTAKSTLADGDFYIYYSEDSKGDNTIPRAAILMDNEEISEVRGVLGEQELESSMLDIVEQQIDELPGGDRFHKKTENMRRVTVLEEKNIRGDVLSPEELRFIYEIDEEIEGFGQKKDPRIEEFREARDLHKDLPIAFDVPLERISFTKDELLSGNKEGHFGNLYFNRHFLGRGKRTLPDKSLAIAGYLEIEGTLDTELPDTLSVAGDLILKGTNIQKFSEVLSVGGRLDLEGSNITELPKNLTVGGSINLYETNITKLPENLTVGRDLWLEGSNITELPENLTVGGSIDLAGINITELPASFSVRNSLYLEGSNITELPENLSLRGSLYLKGTSVTKLPENLTVGGDLDISGLDISIIPEGVIVKGKIIR
jgi:hypothetical protein